MPTDSTVQDLDKLYTQAKSAKARLEPEWYMSLAYFQGEQWLAFSGGRLYRPNMRKGAITYVDNRIQPIVRKELARLTKNQPIFNVIPNSADEEDANAAKLGDDVMLYLWRHLKISKKRMTALRWSRICCAGFLKAFWDPSIGDSAEVLMDPSGQQLAGPNGGPVKQGTPEAQMAHAMAAQQGQQLVVKRIARGDIRLEVRSPFQIFPDPLADQFDEVEWLIEETVKSAEYVRQRYNVDIEPDTPANPGLIEARMGQSGVTQSSGGYKGVKIREYWCKPNPTHPDGYRCVWVGGAEKGQKGPKAQVLATDNAPFDPMPYVMFGAIPVPGRLLGQGIVEPLRGPQTELNKANSQIAENANRIGNPTVLASKQAVQDPSKFNESMATVGGVVWFDDVGSQNAVPSYLNAPQLPEYVAERPQMIVASLQEISGQHEVSSAQVPPGVTAAAAIDLLQEADDTMLGPDVEDHEEELAVLGEKLLNLVGRYYDDSRTIRIGGDNAEWQIFDFRGSMLRGNTRVQVQAGSAFPRSKAAKQAQMQDILTYSAQSGQPIQGRQLARFYEDWGMGATTKFLQDYSITETQCNRENALMAQGRPLQTNDYDDDEGHIANHEDWQRQPHYAQLVAQNPQIGQIAEQHVAAHRQKLQQIAQAQQQMQLQAQGQDPQAQAQAAQMQQAQQQQQMAAQQQQAQMQQAQGAQQLDLKGAQGAQQQGLSQAQAEQQQRQADELHAQKLRHAEEAHQARLRQQSQQAQTQGDNRGNARR